jgi:ribonuclease BN (tRNA processing enzyme)
MTLTVLGCDGSWPGPGGAGSGYLIECAGTRLVVDAGPGTFANLQCSIDPATVDAVVLSHRHTDHWTDLHALATHARFALGRKGIPTFAPKGLSEQSGLSGSEAIDWHQVTDGASVDVGALTCSFHRTDHGVETLAMRIDGGGRALGYSADTGPGWLLAELGTGLDLVLSEATYTIEHEVTAGHMSGRQAGEQAKRSGARRLVITHRWPTIEATAVAKEAEAAFGASVEQAVIGKEFVL